jgi:hypothetical protein
MLEELIHDDASMTKVTGTLLECNSTEFEKRLFTALLRMVLDHCTNSKGTLDSWAWHSNTVAMQLLAEAGLIRINDDTGDRLRGTLLPEAAVFLESTAEST